MITTHRRAAIVAGAVALLTFVAGCSSSGSAASATAAATTTTTTTTAAATTTTVKAPGAGTRFCTVNAAVNGAQSGIDISTATPAQIQHFYQVTMPDSLAKLKAAAPPELQPAVALLAEGLGKFATEFERLGWDAASITKDTVVQAIGANPKYNAANTVINSYCGVAH
jgi:hypothetical protein